MTIKTLLVDDHQMVREGLRTLLEREADIKVIAEASDGEDAIDCARRERPNVVLMDICMPGMNGIEATLRLHAEMPEVRIVALSAQSERPFISQMVEAGAVGFVAKDRSASELAKAIRTVAGGENYLPDPTMLLVGREKRLLSDREQAVLEELATGKRSREVAEAMGISIKTVDTYRHRIMSKLGLPSQAALLRYAVVLNVGKEPSGPILPAHLRP